MSSWKPFRADRWWPTDDDRQRHQRSGRRGDGKNMKTITFKIVGTTPYVQEKFSEKV